MLCFQPQEDKRFHNLALEVWTEDDCVDWLDFIGLGHFATEFRGLCDCTVFVVPTLIESFQ